MNDNNLLDCRGLSCPEPVVRAKKHIGEFHPEKFTVLVDNRAAMENVSRQLEKQNYRIQVAKEGQDWRIEAEKGEPALGEDDACAMGATLEKVCVIVASPLFGSGDDELGGKLMKNFLATLPEFGPSLWLLILLNGGVTLAAKDSPVLEQLRAIKANGTGILVCGACLEHFKLLESRAIGETTNMLDVVTSMQLADKVIKI